MRRALAALAFATALCAGSTADGDQFTEHFGDLETELTDRVAALDPPPDRASRRQKRAATRALNQIGATSETISRDVLTAKRVEAKLRRAFREDETIDGMIGELVTNMRAEVLARIALLDDVATFDTSNTRLQNVGLAAVKNASTLLARADGTERRPRILRLYLRSSRIVDTAVARLKNGPLARDLTGRYIGFYDLTETQGDCTLFHFGDVSLRLTHTGKGPQVTGRATLTEMEVLNAECFFVNTRSRTGDVTATFDGTDLVGTIVLDGRNFNFTAGVQGDTLDGDFTSIGDGSFTAERD